MLGRNHLRWFSGFVLANSLCSDTLRTLLSYVIIVQIYLPSDLFGVIRRCWIRVSWVQQRSSCTVRSATQWAHCLSDFTNIKNICKIVSLSDQCEILTDEWLRRIRSGVSFCPLFFAVKESGRPFLSNATVIFFYMFNILYSNNIYYVPSSLNNNL